MAEDGRRVPRWVDEDQGVDETGVLGAGRREGGAAQAVADRHEGLVRHAELSEQPDRVLDEDVTRMDELARREPR